MGSSKKNNELVKYILTRRPDVNLGDRNGITALMYATSTSLYRDSYKIKMYLAEENRNNQIVDLLLKNGANINAKDINGNTPLILFIKEIGSMSDNALIIERINLLKDADFDIQNSEGETALIRAILSEEVGKSKEFVIESILMKSKKLNLQDNNGNTALILATWYRKSDVVRMLLNRLVDVNIKNKNEESFFDFLKIRPEIKNLWDSEYSKKYVMLENRLS